MESKIIKISSVAYEALQRVAVNKGDMMRIASQAILLYISLGGEEFLLKKLPSKYLSEFITPRI